MQVLPHHTVAHVFRAASITVSLHMGDIWRRLPVRARTAQA